MKKTLLVAVSILAVGIASSKADVAFSVSFGRPAPVYRAPVCAPAPVVVAPAPVVYQPVYHAQPVYTPVYPQPVYAPVYPRPVYKPVYVSQPVYAPVCPQPVTVVQPVYRHQRPVHSGFPGPGFSHPHHGRSRNSVSIRW